MLRFAIIKEGWHVKRNGVAYGNGVSRGCGLAAVNIVDKGESWTQASGTPVITPFTPIVPTIEVYKNGALVASPLIEMEHWNGATRVSFRIQCTKSVPTTDLRLIIQGNYKVTVENQVERYPCAVSLIRGGGTLITLCDGVSVSPNSNYEEAGWCLGGTIDLTLPPGSVTSGYEADGIAAASQYSQNTPIWRSIDFIVQPTTKFEAFGAPLVIERDAWSDLFDATLEDKLELERELHTQYKSLINERRGWVAYGDFPHTPGSQYRCHMNDHYFHTTALFRAVVKSPTPDLWDKIARAAFTYVRDIAWYIGFKAHGKGMAPWSGDFTNRDHWVNSESLLMAWLLYGDEFARQEFETWMASYTAPTGVARDACVLKRMCAVAFAYTANATWTTRENSIRTSVLAAITAGTPGSGYLWHPEWCEKRIFPTDPRPEGIINARKFPVLNSAQRRQRTTVILDGFPIVRNGPGPIGEGHLLMQMHALSLKPHFYPTNVGDETDPERPSLTLQIYKWDAEPLILDLRVAQAIQGSMYNVGVRIYNPSDVVVFDNEDVTLGAVEYDEAGFGFYRFTHSQAGAAGLWTVDITSYAVMVYKPVSNWLETVVDAAPYDFPAY